MAAASRSPTAWVASWSPTSGAVEQHPTQLAYSTKVRLTNGARLSAGLAAGMTQYRLDIGSLVFRSFRDRGSRAVWGVDVADGVPHVGLWPVVREQPNVRVAEHAQRRAHHAQRSDHDHQHGTTFVLMGGQYIKLDRRLVPPAAQCA